MGFSIRSMTTIAACCAGLALMGQTAFAIGGFNLHESDWLSPQSLSPNGEVRINPLRHKSRFPGFGLTGGPLADFNLNAQELHQAVYSLLRDRGMPSFVGIKEVVDKFHNSGTREVLFHFYAYDQRICAVGVKAHVVHGKLGLVSGRFPDQEISGRPQPSDWPNPDVLAERILGDLAGEAPIKVKSKSQCLYNDNGEFSAAWDMIVFVGDLPYRVLATDYTDIIVERRFFDATGTVKALVQNPDDGEIDSFEIAGMSGNRLLNEFFNSQPQGTTPATAEDYNFDFDTSSDQFVEATSFVHANLTLNWFQSFGYQWTGPKPLSLEIHYLFDINGTQTVNNAVYLPETSSTDVPKIRIGDGDGSILRYLPQDVDVVSHEFGHHVVFDHITATRGESLAIHEGLADFFAFQKTDDSCLGESICPTGSTACYVRNTCLRSGETAIRYTDSNYRSLQGHIQGQLISGWLWDLHKYYSVPKEEVTRLVMGALKFLNNSADFANLTDALLQSADERGGTYNCAVGQAAVGRGLDSELPVNYDSETCSSEVGTLNEDLEKTAVQNTPSSVSTEQTSGTGSVDGGGGGGGSSSSKSSSGGGGLFGCAVSPESSRGLPWAALFFFLLPVTLPLLRFTRYSER